MTKKLKLNTPFLFDKEIIKNPFFYNLLQPRSHMLYESTIHHFQSLLALGENEATYNPRMYEGFLLNKLNHNVLYKSLSTVSFMIIILHIYFESGEPWVKILRLLHRDLELMDSKHRNSLSSYGGKTLHI